MPAGNDTNAVLDAPVDNMLDDLKAEAARLIGLDPECRNTVAVLVVGGGEGHDERREPGGEGRAVPQRPGRRVPIHVIAIAPFSAPSVCSSRPIASEQRRRVHRDHGGHGEATTAGAGKFVPRSSARSISPSPTRSQIEVDFNRPPDASHPYGYGTSHQVTSPIVGTVNLENAQDINGNALPNTHVTQSADGRQIPQRSNIMVTTGFTLPGFDGSMKARSRLQAGRGCEQVGPATSSCPTAPGCGTHRCPTRRPEHLHGPAERHGGGLHNGQCRDPAAVPEDVTTVALAESLIDFVRAPAARRDRRIRRQRSWMRRRSIHRPTPTIRGSSMRTRIAAASSGWAPTTACSTRLTRGSARRSGRSFPSICLPKLSALRSGQPIGDFRFSVDGSPKVADVKVDGEWRTYMVIGQGGGRHVLSDLRRHASRHGGDGIAGRAIRGQRAVVFLVDRPACRSSGLSRSTSTSTCNIGSRGVTSAAAARRFPRRSGETWSDPAVGQIGSDTSPFVVLTGSGFFRVHTAAAGQSRRHRRRQHVLRAGHRDRDRARQPERGQRQQR